MTTAKTYDYLVEELSKRLLKAYSGFKPKKTGLGYGSYDKAPDAGKIAHLGILFETSVYRCDEPLAYVGSDRTIYVYDGKAYTNIGNGMSFIREWVKRTMIKLKVGNIYVTNTPDKIAKAIIQGLESTDEYLYRPSARYIAFTNGVFDLEEGRLRAFNRAIMPRLVLDIPYMSANAIYKECEDKFGFEGNPCRRWDRFISDTEEGVLPNKQIREAFQAWCGMLLVDRSLIKIEYMACIYGPGANGKSVLADVIKAVFGDQYCGNFTPKQLFKDGAASEFRMNELSGKIINIVGDLDKSDFSGGEFKSFISGEAVKARGVHEKEFRTVTPPLMLCCANEFPDSADDSEGHHRRLLPLASTTRMWTEKDKDPYLTAKLTTPEARTYVFSWIYEGYKRVMAANGNINLGEEVVRAQMYLKDRSNSMRRWWNDACDYCAPVNKWDGRWIQFKQIHAEYVRYCDEHGEKEVFRNVELGKMLSSVGFSEKRGNKRKINGVWEYLVADRQLYLKEDETN